MSFGFMFLGNNVIQDVHSRCIGETPEKETTGKASGRSFMLEKKMEFCHRWEGNMLEKKGEEKF